MTPNEREPWLVNLECLGTLPGPRFLDGRTANGTVGLAPSTDFPFTGTQWALWRGFQQTILLCLGHVSGPRVLVSPEPGKVGLAGDAAGGTADEEAGSQWVGVFSEAGDKTILTLQSANGFLDGRTADGTLGLAPSTDPPFSGTQWRVHFLGRLVEVFLRTPSRLFLDGRTADGTVGLASVPVEGSGVPPRPTGILWAMLEDSGAVTLRCMGDIEGPGHGRYLDGRTADGSVGLGPSTTPPFTGTRWEQHNLQEGGFALRCLGTISGSRRFLDGRTADNTVGLAPSTDPPFIGTHWNAAVPNTIRGWWFFAPD